MKSSLEETRFHEPDYVLSQNGQKIPILGFGTASYPLGEINSDTKQVFLQAIKVGYRHFDTASIYKTEHPLGEAIVEAISVGLIKSRDELFITSKLWCADAHGDLVLPALRRSLENLKLEYLDLYLIHGPLSFKRGVEGYLRDEKNHVAIDFGAVWAAMEDCQRLGLTKSIGVSNFSCKKVADILAIAKIPPAVNQVEMNPLWQQKKLREFCNANGILLSAYSPLGGRGTSWGTDRVLECEVLKEIAKARGKSVAQVCLRWAYEQGVSIIVKSFNNERMKQNLEIFDWSLSEDEVNKINEIPQQRGYLGKNIISKYGPFKTLEELWDGEI